MRSEGLEALARHSAMLLRREISTEHEPALARLNAGALDLLAAAKRGEVNAATPCLTTRYTLTPADASMVLDGPGSFHRLADAIARPVLDRLGVSNAQRTPYGGVFIADPENQRAPFHWHMDGTFDGLEEVGLNFWIPLSACGNDVPGVAYALGDEDVLHACAQRIDWLRATDADVSAKGPVVAPAFSVGDVLVFTNACIHRTTMPRDCVIPRAALIVRYSLPGVSRLRQLLDALALQSAA